jgi:nucleoside-diphosphate-sugar epimerase
MAVHFNSEDLGKINYRGNASTSDLLVQEYSKLLDLLERRMWKTENLESTKVDVESAGNDTGIYYIKQMDEIKDSCEKFFRGKNIAVTGANGFIGSRIVKRLVDYGANVHVMVREASDLWRIENELEDVNILRVDMKIPETVTGCVRIAKPEYVFHMAAYGVDHRQKDYIEAAHTNIIGTINIINAAKASGCSKLINTGTSMQYGNRPGPIIEESMYKPNNIYGSTKAAATILAHQIAQESEIDIATIIPFGVFGESEGSHKFFPHVILSVLRGIDVELSHCEQFRDYCYVENIIDGFLLAAVNKSIKNGIFNIGSGETYKLKHFVKLITEKMEINCNIKYGSIDYRKNDLWSPKPDIKKISETLGWKPRISLDKGIEMTIEWFRENLDKYAIKVR